MNYHPDDFVELAAAVEQDGGFIQPDACEGTTFKLSMPGNDGKRRNKRYRTTSCGIFARMAVKYDSTTPVNLKLPVYDKNGKPTGRHVEVNHDGEKDRGLAVAPVCAIDDAVGLWPRYADVVTDRSYLGND